MAHAKLVCSECGTELSAVDAICPSCGAAIERRPPKGRAGQAKSPPTVPVSEGKKGGGAGKRFEAWQIVAGLAVVALVAFFVHTELQREHAEVAPVRPQQSPSQGMPQAPRVNIAPLEQAVAANPNDAGVLLRLANGLQDNGAYARAIEVYDRYLAIDPDNPDARVDLGVCYYEMGKVDTSGGFALLETAKKQMELAYTKRPDHQPAAFNLGIVSLTMGDLETSNTWFKRAVELNPTSDLGTRAKRILEQHTVPR